MEPAVVHRASGSSQSGWTRIECWSPLLPYRLVGPSTHRHAYSLEGEREVILAGLTVAHQVAGLFAQPEQVLGICSADGPMVPAEDERGEGGHLCWVPRRPGPPILGAPAGKPVPGGEEEGGSPQLDTDTHTWFSRGSAGSVHSPRGLLGSMPRGLADLGFPADSLGGSRPFSSRPGDRQFSDPSNWAVKEQTGHGF